MYIRARKGTPKNFSDKDFAELSGELSGAIASKPLFYWVARSKCSEKKNFGLFVQFFGFGALFRPWSIVACSLRF